MRNDIHTCRIWIPKSIYCSGCARMHTHTPSIVTCVLNYAFIVIIVLEYLNNGCARTIYINILIEHVVYYYCVTIIP